MSVLVFVKLVFISLVTIVWPTLNEVLNKWNKDSCRLPGVIWELWEDLSYSFPFPFPILFRIRQSCHSGWPVKKKVEGVVILWGGKGKTKR